MKWAVFECYSVQHAALRGLTKTSHPQFQKHKTKALKFDGNKNLLIGKKIYKGHNFSFVQLDENNKKRLKENSWTFQIIRIDKQ